MGPLQLPGEELTAYEEENVIDNGEDSQDDHHAAEIEVQHNDGAHADEQDTQEYHGKRTTSHNTRPFMKETQDQYSTRCASLYQAVRFNAFGGFHQGDFLVCKWASHSVQPRYKPLLNLIGSLQRNFSQYLHYWLHFAIQEFHNPLIAPTKLEAASCSSHMLTQAQMRVCCLAYISNGLIAGID